MLRLEVVTGRQDVQRKSKEEICEVGLCVSRGQRGLEGEMEADDWLRRDPEVHRR